MFVTELAAILKPEKKLLTAAIAVFYKDALTDGALAQYNFMNVMSYDHTGPWTPSKPGPHSTYEHAVADLGYFRKERKIPADKLVLGVGFYGYSFGPELSSTPGDMSYREIVEAYPGSELKDQYTLPGGAIIYYNGMPMIANKTKLAKKEASGIMIWQLAGDATGEKSLLKVVEANAK